MTADQYQLKNKVRIVTATSLFDGHDASINIMRRLLQASGAEVIHLGHDHSVKEVVNCAIQEDANAIAMTSYQGGHNEYFTYMYDLLKENGAEHIKIFGGGGGVILPDEMEMLHAYGIARLYSPDDGRKMGLQGMIDDMLSQCDEPKGLEASEQDIAKLAERDSLALARLISAAENAPENSQALLDKVHTLADKSQSPVLGITGTGGAGKSSLLDELIRRFLMDTTSNTVAVVSVDPSKRRTGGALLGDRIRMNAVHNSRVYMRSLATRQTNLALSAHVSDALTILKAAQFDLIILESSGIGQSDTEIVEHADVSLYVMTPEYGAASQLEKIDMLDFADFIAVNKFDKRGAEDAIRDVRRQYKRNHTLFEASDDELPIYGTIASHFNDQGMTTLYNAAMAALSQRTQAELSPGLSHDALPHDALSHDALPQLSAPETGCILPASRVRYLAEISDTNRQYDQWVEQQAQIAQQLYGIQQTIDAISSGSQRKNKTDFLEQLNSLYQTLATDLDAKNLQLLQHWPDKQKQYHDALFTYSVRGRDISIKTHSESLSHTKIPKVSLPKYQAWGDLLRWSLQENVPGEFPFTSGLFNFKREGEEPTRMFAGEGGPERTNRRFHYVSLDMPAKRLSTAFDSVTLYGSDPDPRPDIYGKIGNAGVSICCLDDVKKLYSGFNLADPKTSVSMTINGPAPMMLGFYLNAAIDQQCEIYIREQGIENEIDAKIAKIFEGKGVVRPCYQGTLPEGNDGLGLMLLGVTGDQILPAEKYQEIKKRTLQQVRGTVQSDILKEDQAQNTCIFSTEFALRLMGDIQEYFINNDIRNFYSVSISGYHMAEAGANPITQLAFTLANGFTFVEYYLSRGMDINDFGPNFSFFFSSGIDPEYAVIGRVARRIWAKAMKNKYGANERAQMLKYHIQTSGRSLHAQEIDFNDIRTTLLALYAIYDNCNSLHTNAYDEAVTTPTEESVRRAMAIQLIINRELGLAKNENPLQGAFIIEELTDLVEQAVLAEFDRLTERGGVLGAMETMYQRSKIQEESLYYENLKHSGEYPIIGVNTFLSDQGSPSMIPQEVIRATEEEKSYQITMLEALHQAYNDEAKEQLNQLQLAAVAGENVFDLMMEVSKVCSIGQIVNALFEVGGQYRRNM